MSNVLSTTRTAALSLIDREWSRTKSKMLAYENVARSIGTTGEWLRKFVSTNGTKDPGLMTGLKIMEIYSRVCERVERAAEDEARLREEINALIECVDRVVVSTDRTKGS